MSDPVDPRYVVTDPPRDAPDEWARVRITELTALRDERDTARAGRADAVARVERFANDLHAERERTETLAAERDRLHAALEDHEAAHRRVVAERDRLRAALGAIVNVTGPLSHLWAARVGDLAADALGADVAPAMFAAADVSARLPGVFDERDRYAAALREIATLTREHAEGDAMNNTLWAGRMARAALGLPEPEGDGGG